MTLWGMLATRPAQVGMFDAAVLRALSCSLTLAARRGQASRE
jgi:hypothetical protein